MRNLRIINHAQKAVDGGIDVASWDLDATCDTLIYTRGPTKSNASISLCSVSLVDSSLTSPTQNGNDISTKSHVTSREIASWDAPCPLPDLESDRVLLHSYTNENQTSYLVLEGGDIITVRHNADSTRNKIEIVGSVDVGLQAAAWSPDESLLALVTKANTFLLMTQDFELVADVTFTPDDSKLSKHVSVGWGKAETQFKGKGAKALRDPTMPEKVDDGELSPFDDEDIVISWRGDSAYVAINSIEPSRGRMVRIYTRDGALDSVSEPVNGLEGALSWRPEGNLLAGVQRLDKTAKIVFFERNGLRHGDFQLRLSANEFNLPIDIQWNSDSSVLAVIVGMRVELWTQSNYHYYLKQTIDSARSANCSAYIAWHPEDPLRLAIWFKNNPNEREASVTNGQLLDEQAAKATDTLMIYRFISTPCTGTTAPPNDLGVSLVIDGRTIKVTALATSMVPPPFSQYSVALSEPPRDVAVSHDNSSLAVLYSDSVDIYSCNITRRRLAAPSFVKSIELCLSNALVPTQLCYGDHYNPVVLCHDIETNETNVLDVRENQSIFKRRCLRHASIFSTWNLGHLFALVDETVLHIGRDGESSQSLSDKDARVITTFPGPVIDFKVWESSSECLAFGLSSAGTLCINNKKLQTQCTSFEISQDHLVYTTARHVLKFLRLDQANLESPSDDPETDSRTRSIERGGRLITVMPSVYSVVLQMPRGNLETIYPRPLVIAAICHHIETYEYMKAFLICRSQRVDMNLLYDFAPIQFLDQIPSIIEQLRKVEHIDLLLSQLSDIDTTATLYKEIIPISDSVPWTSSEAQKEAPTEKITGTKKVNHICEAFLKVLPRYQATNLQNTITAHLCKTPPDIEASLLWISDLRVSNSDLVDDSIEHVCFLADPNQVYDASLGLYDLDLALLVAQQSQKDPREYLPYLQNLQDQSEDRRKYIIDDDLARYAKALQDLYKLEAHEELRKYTAIHQLYSQAMDIYRYESSRHDEILRDYAEHLTERNRFEDAAVAYEALGDFATASESYRAANKWQESLATFQFSGGSKSQLESLALSLAESLEESKDFSSSARIRIDYLSSIEGAIICLCKGHYFGEAIRLAAKEATTVFLDRIIDPGLIEASASLTEVLSECRGQLKAQVPRIRELRLLKIRDPLAFYEGAAAADIPDDISLAPSGVSTTGGTFLTRYTNRTGTIDTAASHKTSKNRRREERKRARGKKGSIYEEEYLVNSVGRLIDRVNSMNGEVSATIQCLLRRAMKERARAIEVIMADVVQQCKDCIAEVWELDISQASAASELAHGRPAGAEGVLWDSQEESKRKVPPVVLNFQRSTLI